jgi:hypothetical protein
MALPIDLDLNHWVRVVPAEGKTQVVKNLGFACYYANTGALELATEGTELATNATVTVESPAGKWFRTKKAASTEIQTPSVLELQPATNPGIIGTEEIANGAVTNPKMAQLELTSALAGIFNQSYGSARSSISWPGNGVPVNSAAQAAETGSWIAVPVLPGDTFKKVAVAGGTAAAATVAEYITAIYAGETGGALLAQSKSVTPGSHPKEEMYSVELESTVTITTANAPKGYVYVLVSAGAAGTMFSFITMTYTTANQAVLGKYGTAGAAANALYNSGGSSIKTKAEATVPTLTAVANVPIVALY